MRRQSRWDQKVPTPPGERSFPDWVNWRDNNESFPSTSHTNRSPSTPVPLDYSTDSRWRAQEAAENRPKNNDPKHPNLIVPNTANLVQSEPWPVIPSYGQYPSSSRDVPVDYTSHNHWNQASSGFFIGNHSSRSQLNDDYHDKWWLPMREDSSDGYRGNRYRKRDRRPNAPYHNYPIDHRRNGKMPMDRHNRHFPDSYSNNYHSFNKKFYKLDRRESSSSSGKYMGSHSRDLKKSSLSENNNDLDERKNRKRKLKSSKGSDQNVLNLDPQLGFKQPPKQTQAEEAQMKAMELAAAKLKTKFLLNKGLITDEKLCHSYVEDLSLPSTSSKQPSDSALVAARRAKNKEPERITLSDSESCSSRETENRERRPHKRRKRYLSESSIGKKQNNSCPVFPLRRSHSESSFQVTPEREKMIAATFGRQETELTNKIRSMDRESLQQLIRDPTSLQARQIAAQLMSIQRANESSRLLRLRFKTAPSSTIGRNVPDTVDELPDHILEQVREILSAEENEAQKIDWQQIGFPVDEQIDFKSPSKLKTELQKEPEIDVEIVTPPPKKAAAMITITDSDSEAASQGLKEFRSRITAKPLSDLVSKNLFEQDSLFNLTDVITKKDTPIPPLLSPLSPIRSASEPDDLNPQMSLKDTAEDQPEAHLDKDIPDAPIASSPISNLEHQDDPFQVKQERSSPVSECGLCMHSPRSPHTPRCGFLFDMPHSPVPLIPGPSSRLPATAQRPVARIPSDIPRLFKDESYLSRQGLFMSLENVDRPSSEERPKNPAPPESASNEPPSPLPIPPPQQTIHNRPRPLIFPPDSDFHAPPRPIPPQPPLHTPRIKVERHTPQYTCCCLKTDCERASNGRQSSDFLRPDRRSVTPQLCDSRTANIFKVEQPFFSARSRPPQQLSAFSMPHSTRTLLPHTPIRLPMCEPLHNEPTAASIAVQTEQKDSSRLDKSTNTQNLQINADVVSQHNRVPEFGVASEYYKVMHQYDQISGSENGINNFGCEKDILNCLQRIDDQTSRLHEYRLNLTEALKFLHEKRIRQYKTTANETVDRASNTEQPTSPATTGFPVPRNFTRESQSPENMSVVSSSQEVDSGKLPREKNVPSPDRERCTSTSHADEVDLAPCNGSEIQNQGFSHSQERGSSIYDLKYYHSPQEIDLNSSSDDVCANDDVMVMGEHRKICGLQSPSSPKCRNYSGSEHGYSLRSRGPPSESNEYNSDSNQQSREPNDSSVEICDDPLSTDEKPSTESPKRKRPRKTKFVRTKRKRKTVLQTPSSQENFVPVPKHKATVVCLEIVEKYVLTACSDGTARLYDPVGGVVIATYKDNSGISAIHVVGSPSLGEFEVITACEDKFLRSYDGNTGKFLSRRETSDSIHCLASRWDYLFLGTYTGNCIRCTLKDKKVCEEVPYSNRQITFILPHTEGGRKVLVVGAKGSPIMVRDAISGLYLRAIGRESMTFFSGVFQGNVFYTGGTDRGINVFDFCSGVITKTIFCPSAISKLLRTEHILIAVCYDGKLRVYDMLKGEMVKCLATESTKLIVSSALYDRKVLVGNKLGEVLSVDLDETLFVT